MDRRQRSTLATPSSPGFGYELAFPARFRFHCSIKSLARGWSQKTRWERVNTYDTAPEEPLQETYLGFGYKAPKALRWVKLKELRNYGRLGIGCVGGNRTRKLALLRSAADTEGKPSKARRASEGPPPRLNPRHLNPRHCGRARHPPGMEARIR